MKLARPVCLAAVLLCCVSCDKGLGSSAKTARAPYSSPACPITGSGEVRDLALSKCLTADTPQPVIMWNEGPPHPAVLYFDRSGSMQGFLDPDYPGRSSTDFRSVIDRLVVGLTPARAYGFGSAVRPVQASLGVLGSRRLYSDNDTRMEQVLDSISRDTVLTSNHIVVGDGRRGSPDVANGQFVRMREVATQWIHRGGTFMIGSSLAPFKPVPNDAAGCRRASTTRDADAEDETAPLEKGTCPLYVFAFVASGDESRVAESLAAVFQHLFAWPVPSLPNDALVLQATGQGASSALERRWARAPGGAYIARVRGTAQVNRQLHTIITVSDTAISAGRTWSALLAGEGLHDAVDSHSLAIEAQHALWTTARPPGSHVITSTNDALSFDVVSHGRNAPPYLYRIDLVPSGVPTWLDDFDAADAHDAVRTYGLSRLFESFRDQDSRAPRAMGRLYLVVN